MKRANHTPGPWTIDFTTLCAGEAPSAEDLQGTFRIRECAAHEYAADDIEQSSEVADANAQLIASAPELVEALKRAVETFADTCDCNECGACVQRHEFETLIAKATGGDHE